MAVLGDEPVGQPQRPPGQRRGEEPRAMGEARENLERLVRRARMPVETACIADKLRIVARDDEEERNTELPHRARG